MSNKKVTYILVLTIIILGLITINIYADLKKAEQAHKKELAYVLIEIGSEFTKISTLLTLYKGELSLLEKELLNRLYMAHVNTIMNSSNRIERNIWKSLPDNYSLSIIGYKEEDSLIYFMNYYSDKLNEENAKIISRFSSDVGRMFSDLAREKFEVFYSGDYQYKLEEIFNDIHNEINIIKQKLDD